MNIVMGDFTDIDVDALDLLGLNILNDPLVLTQEMNGDIEHAEDTPPPLKECDDNDKIAENIYLIMQMILCYLQIKSFISYRNYLNRN